MLDTLVCDTARLGAWQRCGLYAYNDQLSRPNRNVFEELLRLLDSWFSKATFDVTHWTFSQIAAFLVVVAVLTIFSFWLWQNRYRWTGRLPKKSKQVAYTVEDDNIYGVDFDRILDEAVRRGNHNETIRIVYLRQLRRLADDGILYWTPGLTPNDYVRSIPPGDDRDVLRRMTGEYVRVRFGHYDVSPEAAEAMLRLAAEHVPQTKKGGEA